MIPSVYLIRPLTDEAKGWIEEWIPADATSFAGGVAVEWRYLDSIIAAMLDFGLALHTDFEVIS